MVDYGYYPVGYPVSNSSSVPGRQRHYYNDAQLELLDAEFALEPFPSRENRHRIASQIGVTEKSVLWWFQNRRRRVRQRCKVGEFSGLARPRRQRRSSPYVVEQQRPDLIDNGWNLAAPSNYWPACSDFVPVTDAHLSSETDQYSSESSSPTQPTFMEPVLPVWTDVSSNYVAQTAVQDVGYGSQSYSVATEPITPCDMPEFQPQPTYSYWNNWQYNPPFYPSSIWYPNQ